MRLSKEKLIPLMILLTPIFSILITAFFILGVSYFTLNDFYKQQKEEITKNFFNELKYNTKKRVEIAYSVLDLLYKEKKNKEETLKEFRKLLDKIRWGKGGYIFVYDFHGNTIYHPKHSLIGKNRWDLKRNGIYILRYLTKEALKHPDGVYVEYLAYNPYGGKPLKKVSYLKVYKPLGIFLGSGVYLNSLDKELLRKQRQYKNLFMKFIVKIALISIIVLIIVLGVTSLISIYVKRVFKEYNKALKKEKEFFYERSIHDGLTGLYNRNYFTELLEKYIKLAKRENKKFAVLFLDLDNFKEINDTLSHKVGDYVLQIIAQRLKNVLRESDVVARFGGDEFVIGIFGFRENDDLEIIIQKIIDAIKQPIQYNNQTFEVTGSIGVAIYPKDGESVGKLIKNADAAMYKAKKEKGVFEFYTEKINEEVKRHMKLKQEIKEAIKNNEFVPYFQPQMDKEEKLYGSEVLVRWIKDGKIIPPFEFIPFAIEMGVIDQIDKLVIENALIQWKKWELKGYKPGVISCNITMQHVEKTDFLSFIKGLLNKYSFDPSMLNLEVTEQSVMQNPEESIKIFEKIRDLGIGINIDDFGTGYSSLSYLKKLPIDKLKIDKSFIDGIPYDNDDVKITTTIIALAKGLNLKIVAEGVENKIQRDFLIDHGCDYIQGYYYSPPISAEDFEKKYLKEENES